MKIEVQGDLNINDVFDTEINKEHHFENSNFEDCFSFTNQEEKEYPFGFDEPPELEPFYITFEKCENSAFSSSDYVVVFAFSKDDAIERYEQEHPLYPEFGAIFDKEEWGKIGGSKEQPKEEIRFGAVTHLLDR